MDLSDLTTPNPMTPIYSAVIDEPELDELIKKSIYPDEERVTLLDDNGNVLEGTPRLNKMNEIANKEIEKKKVKGIMDMSINEIFKEFSDTIISLIRNEKVSGEERNKQYIYMGLLITIIALIIIII